MERERAFGGHSADKSIFHNQELWEKYVCPVCELLLKDAVQTSCGHWGCESCVNNLLATESLPRCRNKDCREELKDEDGAQFFKDRFVRREVLNLLVNCDYKEKGCAWTGKFQEREAHLKVCEHNSTQCELCGETIAAGMAEQHRLHLCPNAVMDCPYQILGCSNKNQMPKSDMEAHLHENQIEHANHVVKFVSKIENAGKETKEKVNHLAFQVELLTGSPGQTEDQGYGSLIDKKPSRRVETDSSAFIRRKRTNNSPPLGTRLCSDSADVELSDSDLPAKIEPGKKNRPRIDCDGGDILGKTRDLVERDGATGEADSRFSKKNEVQLRSETDAVTQMFPRRGRGKFDVPLDVKVLKPLLDQMKEEMLMTMRVDFDSKASGDSRRKDAEISNLKERILQLEKTLRAKTAEAEDRDFRLSLIENSNYDGNMVWKIPQFSQRKADAESGKYTSIFSLPFYTGRYGYKMCLRLYILGDGIGKNTHMSLFFVVMRGEFDNILQWPFTHKVTFKLINQKGARDVIDTFQPDPMSSSFRKPKSDMNIASGCPRFVSHQELQNGGFIEDDTVFIKCVIDKNTIHHP